jgi:hypothetical protein
MLGYWLLVMGFTFSVLRFPFLNLLTQYPIPFTLKILEKEVLCKMIKLKIIMLFTLILFLFCLNCGSASDLPQAKGPNDEKIAGIALGDEISKVIELLGEPEKKTEPVEEPATGYKVQHYIYKTKGIEIFLDLNEKKVVFITIESPCEEGTLRGVKIGDTESKVRKNYILSDPQGNVLDKSSLANKSAFCGDVYWGIRFVFDKAGKVKTISMGAFAE